MTTERTTVLGGDFPQGNETKAPARDEGERTNEGGLLPCPFCAEPNPHLTAMRDHDDRRYFERVVECGRCEATMPVSMCWGTYKDLSDREASDRLERDAISAWNTRAALSPAQTGEAAVRFTGRKHDLKCWPEPFAAIRAGLKHWELRLNDRDYQVGDLLWNKEWDPATEQYTGEATGNLVIWMLNGPAFGLPAGYCIMSLDRNPALATPPVAEALPVGEVREPTEAEKNAARDAVQAVLERHGYDIPGVADLCGIAAIRTILQALDTGTNRGGGNK